MDSPEDVLPTEDRCEVCGGRLGDEIVIQEFADGSLARLCAECAAGAALDEHERHEVRPPSVVWPAAPADAPAEGPADFDPLEKTRELLLPVTDLIALQAEMQSALERLASSLERFAAEMLTEAQGKTAVESRLQMLERELDKTRARLAETEFLLTSTLETAPGALAGVDEAAPAPGALAAAAMPAAGVTAPTTEPPEAVSEASGEKAAEAAPPSEPVAPPFDDLWKLVKARAEQAALDDELDTSPEAGSVTEAAIPGETGPLSAPAEYAEAKAAEGPVPEPAAESAPPAAEEAHGTGFRIDEVQAAQRYYNESPFVNRIRDVRESLGRPKANLTRVPGGEPRAILTVAWDIVWYQYLIDLRRDLPSTHERVVLHREGMDLDELAYYFKEPNSLINDDGKLDASELEVRLLSDPSALITEMTQAEMQALEDATEEIWDHHVAPEFKWDD